MVDSAYFMKSTHLRVLMGSFQHFADMLHRVSRSLKKGQGDSEKGHMVHGKSFKKGTYCVCARCSGKTKGVFPICGTTQSYEPRHDKTCLREFPTRPATNRPAQPLKLARVLKFWL